MDQDGSALFYRPVDQPATAWIAVLPLPSANRGFIETRRYVFQGSAGWALYIDDEPLNGAANEPSSWEWQPGFFAGEVTAELFRADGVSAGLFLLDVAPDPGKLGQQFFGHMVKELWEEDPTLVIGNEPATIVT